MFNVRSKRKLQPDYSCEVFHEAFGISKYRAGTLQEVAHLAAHHAIEPHEKGVLVHKKRIINALIEEMGAVTHEQAFFLGMLYADNYRHADEIAEELKDILSSENPIEKVFDMFGEKLKNNKGVKS